MSTAEEIRKLHAKYILEREEKMKILNGRQTAGGIKKLFNEIDRSIKFCDDKKNYRVPRRIFQDSC